MSSETDVSESEEEEHEGEQKTAVAATRSNRNTLIAQIPLRITLLNEHYADSMRKGLAETKMPCSAIRQLGQSPDQFRKTYQTTSM